MLVDKVNEAKMIVESNSQVITSLRDYYKTLEESEDFPLRASCRGGIRAFIAKLDYKIVDFKMHAARADLLLRNSDDLKNIVSSLLYIRKLSNDKQRCSSSFKAKR
jgi:hypothetical protein